MLGQVDLQAQTAAIASLQVCTSAFCPSVLVLIVPQTHAYVQHAIQAHICICREFTEYKFSPVRPLPAGVRPSLRRVHAAHVAATGVSRGAFVDTHAYRACIQDRERSDVAEQQQQGASQGNMSFRNMSSKCCQVFLYNLANFRQLSMCSAWLV